MCGLLTPDEGEGRVLGHDIRTEGSAIKRQVGYMTQKFSFYEDLSIAENMTFVARALWSASGLRAWCATRWRIWDCSRAGTSWRAPLSGGWKQRLALAACIMHKPKLLLLDEPTAGVDPKARREFWDEIHLRARSGLTVLVSTHYMDEAERCHRIHYISLWQAACLRNRAGGDPRRGSDHLCCRRRRQSPKQHCGCGAWTASIRWRLFGLSLHVVGRDKVALAAAVAKVAGETGVGYREGATSLEDVFIQFMAQSTDNMA